ncbi:MAG: aminotransferase class I/II-fold pyridoxal phosphate-dependent enzyme, partial [Myxococcota bacterium]
MTAIPEALAALIAQQARFDQLRHHTNLRTNGRVADLAYANAYDGPPPAVIDALRTVIDDPRALNLQYTPYGGATKVRRLVARNLSKRHGLKYRFTDIVMTPGAMAGLNLALRPLASGPRREVIILTPCWLDYPAYVYNLGLTMRLVPLKAKSFDLDIEAIAAALSPNTAAIMLSQPANPTGLLYSRASLDALAEVLRSQAEPPLLIA